jgi:hypothetical protein
MSEFDFDEIDKAVTSAMGGSKPAPVAEPEPVAVVTPQAPAPEPAPVVKEDIPVVINKPAAPAVRRSTGRIMDVMPRAASRPASAKAVINTPAPVQEKPSDIDLAPTPFLPDANEKVEKRPLGSAGLGEEFAPVPAPSSAPAESEVVPELGSVDQAVNTNAPIPAELHDDVLSLESSTETPEEPPVAGTSPEAESAVAEPIVAEPEAPVSQPVPDVAPSIVQQYQEKVSSSNEQPGAIYDTQAYHTPLKEQPKKKAPILFIAIWIVGLIVVGAAAGWAVYTFVLPRL